MTIHERVARARTRFRAVGIPDEEADLDARVLAEYVLEWDTARFLASASDIESPDFAARYEALTDRRTAREPVAHITGRQEFWGLRFEVSPAVLIPRPETELLVETALELFPERDTPFRAADLCTGSGCVGVAIAHERPVSRFIASDVSADALAVASRNAGRHGVADRVEIVESDLLNRVTGTFDVIVSNPPYVPERDRSSIQPEVRDHEPGIALFAGDDGLRIIRRLIADAGRALKPGGVLMFEFGFGQAEAVRQLISDTGDLTLMELRADLQGIPRISVSRKR